MTATGLPAEEKTADAHNAAEFSIHDGADRKKQYTVFLVEDDPDDQEFILKTLKRSPYIYNVHCFKNGGQLIEHIVKEGYYGGFLIHNLPTLILLDIHMPGESGIELLDELKGHPLTADIPVIMVTNDLSQESAVEAFKLKANAYVTKPIHLDPIHEVINTGWGWAIKKKNAAFD